MKIKVKVSPNSNEIKVKKRKEGSYKVRLKSSPKRGKANRELIEVLSNHFGVSEEKVRILKGVRSRKKLLEISD